MFCHELVKFFFFFMINEISYTFVDEGDGRKGHGQEIESEHDELG